MTQYHCDSRTCSSASQTWCLRRGTPKLFLGGWACSGKAHFSRKGCGYRKARGYFPGPLTESMGNCGHSCCFCCPTLVHKQDVKSSNSSDRATGQIPDTLRPIICNHCRPNPIPESSCSPAVSNGNDCSGVAGIQGKLQEWGRAALAGDSWQPQSRNPSPLGLQPSNGSYCSWDELFSEACHPLGLLHLQLPLSFFTEVMPNYLFTTSPLLPDCNILPFVKVLC